MWRKTGFAKRLLLCTSLVVVVGGLAVAALVASQVSPASGSEIVPQCWPTPTPTPPPLPYLVTDKNAVSGECERADIELIVRGEGDTVGKPLDVMLVLDRSGSMDDAGCCPPQPITDAKDAAKSLVDELNPAFDRVGLVSYSNQGRLDRRLTNNFDAVKSAINGMTASGYTNIGDGVKDARRELNNRGRDEAAHVIVLLSDGVANRKNAWPRQCTTWPTTETACTLFARSQAAAAKDQGIIIFTIGLGLQNVGDEHGEAVENLARSTLQDMASAADNYFDAPSSADLEGIFDAIADIINNIAGYDVTVIEVLPSYMHYIADSAWPLPTTHDLGPPETLTWDLGIVAIGKEHRITFSAEVDVSATGSPVLADVWPDTRVEYLDYLDNPHSVPFPKAWVTVEPCDKLGDLKIKKRTDGSLTPGVTFTVNPNPYVGLDPTQVPVGCDGDSAVLVVTDGDACDRHDGADGTVTLVHVPADDYLVDEAAPPPGTAFVGCDPNPVTVPACGGSGSTTCTNKKLGQLKIVKETEGVNAPSGVTFTVNPNPYVDLDPALVPAGCDGDAAVLVVTDGDACDHADGADATVRLVNVPTGGYLVDEAVPPAGTAFVECDPNPVTVPACGGCGSTTCTNELGDLTIDKLTDGVLTPGVTFIVTPNPYVAVAALDLALVPTDCDYASAVLVVTDGDACDRHDGADGTVTLVNVLAGDYEVTEAAPPPGTTFVGCDPESVTVPAGGSGSTICTNKEEELGELEIVKETEGVNAPPGVTFTVNPNPYLGLDPSLVPAGCDSASLILTVTDGDACDRHDDADGTITLVNVPAGDYLVDEPVPPAGTAFVECDPNPVTVPACGGSGSTTCTNKLGDLTIDKLTDGVVTPGVTFTVDPNPYVVVTALAPALVPAGCDDASPVLAVTDGDACDRADGADGTITLVNVLAGDYQVDEPAPPPGTTFEGCEPDPVTVPAGGSGSTICTNTPSTTDGKIIDQELVEPPSTMKVGEGVDVTVRKTLHNNGPNGPIEVSIISTASPPAGCTATPKDVPSTVTLPVSVNVVIEEVWTIECSTAGNRVFWFDNCIEVETPGVGDVNLENNCASTGLALIVAQVRCPPWDRDCDGYYNYIEIMWGSDPDDKDSTPEHRSAAGTCTDGLDNDKDGLTDGADPGC